tara:strand:- start:69 stop:542 length:474 start_codon:yes stop_codon:yes gene_type:complete
MMNYVFNFVNQDSEYLNLKQGDKPPKELLKEFRNNRTSSLFATRMFFQGIDIPGPSLGMVVIDRLPFPGPNEHLIQAWFDKAEVASLSGFNDISLPICRTRLAQAVGRLIRRNDDTGVVAVLDPRLADSDYRQVLLQGLPPMARTRDVEEVATFFND